MPAANRQPRTGFSGNRMQFLYPPVSPIRREGQKLSMDGSGCPIKQRSNERSVQGGSRAPWPRMNRGPDMKTAGQGGVLYRPSKDRKSVVEGKRVSVRVDIGCRLRN